MGARHARRLEDEPVQVIEEKAPEHGPSTAEEYRAAIGSALNEAVRFAHRLAAEGLALFPDNQELLRLSRLLNLPPGAEALQLFTPDPDYGFLWHPLPPVREVADPSTPEDFLEGIRLYLNQASSTRAQRLAAEGHRRFPDHPELERLCRLLTPRPARSVPGSGEKKKGSSEKAYRWLDENEMHYRGQWILVGEDGLVASAPTLKELLRKIEEIGPDPNAFIHHVH